MCVKLQLVMCNDDGQEETVTDVVTLKKDHRRLEHLGLTLAEAKQLLKTLQHRVSKDRSTRFSPRPPRARTAALESMEMLGKGRHRSRPRRHAA